MNKPFSKEKLEQIALRNAAEKFADDFIGNNPAEFETSQHEEWMKDVLTRTYIAGAKKHTYVEMGYKPYGVENEDQ